MTENTFTFESKGNVKIFVRKWMPEDNTPKAVFQIAHGMAEHSIRYKEFVEFLTNLGYVVYAHDHRGHGKTAGLPEDVGNFALENGWELVVEDIYNLAKKIKDENPNLKHFILGHSMGSFITRTLLTKYDIKFDGAIISGTNFKRGFIVNSGKFLGKIQGAIKGKTKPSKLLDKMSFGSYNKPFKPIKTQFDWLSRDYDRNKDYVDDPYCGVVMSNRFFVDMLTLIGYANNFENMNKVPKDLPIFIFSGAMDPVGEFGKEVEAVYNKYKTLGVKDIKLKLYEGGRHEMLNETNRQEVYNDITTWIEERL